MANPRETRIHTSLLAAVEKRGLVWMAQRLPAWVSSDQLTALGAVAMLGAGLSYWLGASYPLALIGVVLMLAVNWFGDSLDGTLARVRKQERPRYGFYVDHVLDVVGMLFLFSGLALGGFMTPFVAAALLVAYYLLNVEIALATHTVGTFRISYWKVGPTELRILLAIGTLQLLRSAEVTLFGGRYCFSTWEAWWRLPALRRRSSCRRSRTRGFSTSRSRCRARRTPRSGTPHPPSCLWGARLSIIRVTSSFG